MIDLKKRTYEFSLQIIRLLEALPKDYVSITMGKQLLRAGTSIGANVVEAYGASSRKDFANFFNHSLKSANESIYWLRLLNDSKRLKAEQASLIVKECEELSRILGASLVSLRKKKSD